MFQFSLEDNLYNAFFEYQNTELWVGIVKYKEGNLKANLCVFVSI